MYARERVCVCVCVCVCVHNVCTYVRFHVYVCIYEYSCTILCIYVKASLDFCEYTRVCSTSTSSSEYTQHACILLHTMHTYMYPPSLTSTACALVLNTQCARVQVRSGHYTHLKSTQAQAPALMHLRYTRVHPSQATRCAPKTRLPPTSRFPPRKSKCQRISASPY